MEKKFRPKYSELAAYDFIDMRGLTPNVIENLRDLFSRIRENEFQFFLYNTEFFNLEIDIELKRPINIERLKKFLYNQLGGRPYLSKIINYRLPLFNSGVIINRESLYLDIDPKCEDYEELKRKRRRISNEITDVIIHKIGKRAGIYWYGDKSEYNDFKLKYKIYPDGRVKTVTVEKIDRTEFIGDYRVLHVFERGSYPYFTSEIDVENEIKKYLEYFYNEFYGLPEFNNDLQ